MLIHALHRLLDTILFTPEELSDTYPSSSISTALFSYKDPQVQRLIRKIKYYGNRRLADHAGKLLYRHILAGNLFAMSDIANSDNSLKRKIVLVSVPISKKKLRQRGHNQAQILVEAVLKNDTSGIFQNGEGLVQKIKETKNQAECTRKERLANLEGAFQLHLQNKEEITMLDIVVIIDDITTTGATFKEVAKTIQEKHPVARVFCLAFAH